MWNGRPLNDPTGQILSTWIAKEELRRLLGAAARGHIAMRSTTGSMAFTPDAPIPRLPS
jgi:hypothetical protein